MVDLQISIEQILSDLMVSTGLGKIDCQPLREIKPSKLFLSGRVLVYWECYWNWNFSPNMFLDRNCASYCDIFRSAGMIADDAPFLGNVHNWAQWLMVANVVVNMGEASEKVIPMVGGEWWSIVYISNTAPHAYLAKLVHEPG